jgi:hypothetical protein
MIQEQEKLDNALTVIKDIKERAKTRRHLWLYYLETSGKNPNDLWILRMTDGNYDVTDNGVFYVIWDNGEYCYAFIPMDFVFMTDKEIGEMITRDRTVKRDWEK